MIFKDYIHKEFTVAAVNWVAKMVKTTIGSAIKRKHSVLVLFFAIVVT